MAIVSVRLKLDGAWYPLSYSAASGKWEKTITAPAVTSFNLTDGVYNGEVEVTTDDGVLLVSGDKFNGLLLKVIEKIKPTAKIIGSDDAGFNFAGKRIFTFELRDDIEGSGVDLDTVVILHNGSVLKPDTITEVEGGYDGTFIVAADTEGSHRVEICVSDYDGNKSAVSSADFFVDITPPSITLTSPKPDLITRTAAITVSGFVTDALSQIGGVSVFVDETACGDAAVNGAGSFSKQVTLSEGENVITVYARDSRGKAVSDIRRVLLDSIPPVFESVELLGNLYDITDSFILKVVVR